MSDNVFIDDAEDKNPNALNLKRVLERALRYWYVVVISLIIALGIAFLINRYADRIYPSKISILIKETEEVSGNAELLFNNPLINPYRNYFNEVYIIKSIPLIQQVVEDLNFMVSYRHEGEIKNSEIYKLFPFTTILLADSATIQKRSFGFKILNQDKLALYSGEELIVQGNFNDSINANGVSLYFNKDPEAIVDKFINVKFYLHINNSFDIASQYANQLTIEWAEEGSSVLNLSITGEVPEKNNDFLNQLALVYSEVDLNRKVETASKSIDFIQSQLNEIEDSLTIYEAKLENFKAENYTTELDNRSLDLLNKLEELENKRGELMVYENYFSYLREYINDPDQVLDQVVLPSMVGVSDPVINNLLTELLHVQNQLQLQSERVERNNPLVETAYKKLNDLKKQVLESIKNLEATQQITINRLNNQIRVIEDQLHTLPATQRRFITINRNYKFSERLYDLLIQKKTEADISKASSTSDIQIINPATNGGAIYPNTSNNYAIAALGGMILPVLLFILLEILNKKVQSKEDIENLTTIPFIGSIGHAKIESNLLVYHNPKSAIAEGFRAIRSNLNYFTEKIDKKIFLITSSISGEGKTFTTINLATVLSFSGKKTLIIGADMRKPRIFGDFNLENNIGLSSYLSDQKTLQECIQPTFVENLSLLPAGPVPPNPSELLLRAKFDLMFKELQQEFDYIFIDSPPLALVTDSLVISEYVDHVVYITRQNVTPKETLVNIDEHYKAGKIKNISLLFNDIRKTGLGYGYGEGYGYYYGYKEYGYYEENSSRS